MATTHPVIEDPTLGTLTRAETTLDDGDVVTHDWYSAHLTRGDREIELMIDGTDVAEVKALLPRATAVITGLDDIERLASDAIVARFSDTTPTQNELDDAADDLLLEAVETTAEDTVLHFIDSCGLHFPEGYWPAVHLDVDGEVVDVTVEA